MSEPDIAKIHRALIELSVDIDAPAAELVADWRPRIEREAFRPSADNLACYIPLRHRDLQPVRRKLMRLGLSSLGRLESRVAPSLAAVTASPVRLQG
jgi:pyruvate kinase